MEYESFAYFAELNWSAISREARNLVPDRLVQIGCAQDQYGAVNVLKALIYSRVETYISATEPRLHKVLQAPNLLADQVARRPAKLTGTGEDRKGARRASAACISCLAVEWPVRVRQTVRPPGPQKDHKKRRSLCPRRTRRSNGCPEQALELAEAVSFRPQLFDDAG